jgi:hypothetical protein
MKEIVKKLSVTEVKILMELMKLSATKGEGSGLAPSHAMKLDLSSIDLKLDGPDMYLSWSHKIEAALVGKRLDGYLTGAKVEPTSNNVEKDEWKTTRALLALHLAIELDSSKGCFICGWYSKGT